MARICFRQINGARHKLGHIVAIIPDGALPGSAETPERGYVWVELKGVDTSDAALLAVDKKVLNPAFDLQNPDSEPTYINTGERAKTIKAKQSPIPLHSAQSKYSKSFTLRAGRSIHNHLQKMVVPTRRTSLVITNT